MGEGDGNLSIRSVPATDSALMKAIHQILTGANLPIPGMDEPPVGFFAVECDGEIAGCAVRESYALLGHHSFRRALFH